jgi:hypothetical protein
MFYPFVSSRITETLQSKNQVLIVLVEGQRPLFLQLCLYGINSTTTRTK